MSHALHGPYYLNNHIPNTNKCFLPKPLQDTGLPHFRLLTHTVSEPELLAGRENFVLHGAGPLKKKKDIGPHNILVQMANYCQYSHAGESAMRLAPLKVRPYMEGGEGN